MLRMADSRKQHGKVYLASSDENESFSGEDVAARGAVPDFEGDAAKTK
jgi:hypothetical protein